MGRLNVVSGGDDREINSIRATVLTFDNVDDLDDLISLLRGHGERGDRVEVLDAIGHSRSHGFLVMGTWVIDDSPQTAATFSELLRPLFQRLGIRTIRLLGCTTAIPERGRNAIRRIAAVTGCRVFGTKRFLSKYDYSPSGFASDDTLVDADGMAFTVGAP